jgi:hypothetical protein
MRDSCPGSPGFYLYSTGTDAHFSNSSVYPTEVCTGRLDVELRSLDPDGDGAVEQENPCEPGEKQLFSVSNFTNAHIGSPYNDFYRFKACGLLGCAGVGSDTLGALLGQRGEVGRREPGARRNLDLS